MSRNRSPTLLHVPQCVFQHGVLDVSHARVPNVRHPRIATAGPDHRALGYEPPPCFFRLGDPLAAIKDLKFAPPPSDAEKLPLRARQ